MQPFRARGATESGPPVIAVDKHRFTTGDHIRANCTVGPSFPAPNITWLVDNMPFRQSWSRDNELIEVSSSKLSRAKQQQQASQRECQQRAEQALPAHACKVGIPSKVHDNGDDKARHLKRDRAPFPETLMPTKL
ncbi:Fasciclin-3 [Frankliniella fusca]|uniref:Fasciclin-3 n=1 Tax=Frankliniella fusca TaxID=407009 RepID=A0AAE1HYQ2_9NEOP|nr:Fasciclin-3 [Frankliniella fusca]